MKRCVRAVAHAAVLATATGGCGLASVHAAEPRATLAATLIVQADDPRLARARLERRYLGHPEGPARQGLDVALDEGRFELQAGRAAGMATIAAGWGYCGPVEPLTWQADHLLAGPLEILVLLQNVLPTQAIAA